MLILRQPAAISTAKPFAFYFTSAWDPTILFHKYVTWSTPFNSDAIMFKFRMQAFKKKDPYIKSTRYEIVKPTFNGKSWKSTVKIILFSDASQVH